MRYFSISFRANTLISGVRSLASSGRTPCGVNAGGLVGGRIDRLFLDWPHRLPGHAVEDVGKPLLGDLSDGLNPFAVNGYRDQVRRRWIVIIPEAMVDVLK